MTEKRPHATNLPLVARKLRTITQHPYRSVNSKLRWYAHHVCEAVAVRNLRRTGALHVVQQFIEKRPLDAQRPDFCDLWTLYHVVRRRKPQVVLEFGSGCSTVVLAQALKDNEKGSPRRKGHLYSVDADPYWTKMTANSLPSSVADVCEVMFSPLLDVEMYGTLCYQHSRLPSVVPNLVYLDGPALTRKRRVAVDLLYLEPDLPADFFMVIDGRKENTAFLLQYLRRTYRVTDRAFFNNRFFEILS